MTDHPHPHADDLACTEEVEIMTDYLEGALRAADVERLEAHLENCPGCTEYLAQMRTIAGGLGDLREDEIPAGMRDELLGAFRELRRN